MKRPSMFSRDYERKMRKIKIRNRILVSLGIIIVVGGTIFFVFRKEIINTSYFSNNFLKKTEEVKKDDISKNEIEKESKDEEKDNQPKQEEALGKDIDLGNGKFVKLSLKKVNDKLEFENIENNGNNISFDISPQKTNSVIVDNDNQNIYLVDINGSLVDISSNTYTASNGNVFNKGDILKQNNNYVWHKSAKFLNDNTIIYLSQLPWFNKTDKYVWSVDLNTKNHSNLNIQGQDIVLGNLTDKGIEITIDGVLKYINSNGTLVD